MSTTLASARRANGHVNVHADGMPRGWLDTVPIMAWVSAPDKKCIYFNRQWQEFTGHPMEELLGDGWVEDVHPEDRRKCIELYERSFDAKKRFTMEYRLRRHDGKYRRIVDVGVPCFSGRTTFVGYTGAAVDIAEMGVADGSMESEARFKALFECDALSLAFWTMDGRIVDANQSYLRLTGRTRGELEKGTLHCGNLTPEEYKELDARAIHELRTGKARARSWEKEYVRPDGRRVPVWISAALLPGYPDRGVACALDLTRQKATERELQENRALLDTVFKSLNGLVVVVNRAGSVIAVKESQSASFRKKSAIHDEIKVGQNYLRVCRKAQARGDRDAGAAWNGIAGVLHGKLPEFKLEYSYPGSHKSLWFEMSVQPLDRAEGGAIITHQDVTRRREAELEAQLLLQELAHVTRVSLLGELAGSFAHELSQPLTATLNNSIVAQRLISKSCPDAHELQETVRDIVALNRRANGIVHRLRTMLKKEKVKFKAINFNKMVSEVVELMRDEAILRKVKVSRNLAHNLPLVRGDRVQLQQVCLNLMANAFDAMRRVPARLRQLTVRTGAPDEKFVILEVHDSGPGIPPDKLQTIFDPYFTTKSKGMGIGLSICRSIVNAHQGKISVATNHGHGATFHVALPAVRAARNAN